MKKLCLLLACLLLVGAASAEENRYADVFDTSADAGVWTMRFLWLGPQVAEDKPGDCVLMTSPEGKVLVLDAGHPLATEYVIAALDAMGVTTIDYLIASHPHIDHIGGFPALMARYDVRAVYTSALTYETSPYYQAYLRAFEASGVPHTVLREGDRFQFGERITVEVFNPPAEIAYPKDYPKGSTQFINNHSLALKFTFDESTAMLAGDLYATGEQAVVGRWGEALDCDVLKANHHGSNTSSSSAWRKAVTPRITVITSDTLEDLNIARKFTRDGQQMLHTLMDGCVKISTAGDGKYAVLTKKDRATSLFD